MANFLSEIYINGQGKLSADQYIVATQEPCLIDCLWGFVTDFKKFLNSQNYLADEGSFCRCQSHARYVDRSFSCIAE